MISNNQMQKIAAFVKKYLRDTVDQSELDWVKRFSRAADHRWQHTLNVLHNANLLLEGEESPSGFLDTVRVAALLHDISLFTCKPEEHGQKSADIAGEYLRSHGYAEDFIHIPQNTWQLAARMNAVWRWHWSKQSILI